ncbi:Chromosome X 58 [Branchiostoma belcheri]|nr:Chromosome X 58 [Branchiostoma belcheri]
MANFDQLLVFHDHSAKEQNGPEGGSPQNGTVHSISPGPRGSKISIKIPSEHAYQQTETQTDEFLMGPRPGSVAEDEIIKMTATRVIERAWLSYRDRQMFKLLKHAVCAAEHCLSFEILRKVSPMEANLLKDPSFQVRVRFRFAGSDFPPEIVFKVFIHTGGQGVNYVSGKRVIKPATNAAADSCRLMGHRMFYDQMIRDAPDSCRLMGHRKFYDQMIRDACQHEKDRVTDEIDIITMKDYMQYLSNMDETPAYMGGKENLWRKLSLEGWLPSNRGLLSNSSTSVTWTKLPPTWGARRTCGGNSRWKVGYLATGGYLATVGNLATVFCNMQYLSNMDETPTYMGGKENLWRKLSLEGWLPSNRGYLATVGNPVTVFCNMQYLSNMDETPAYMGGKENLWRKLSLEGEIGYLATGVT